jgi:hypothetical protein
LESNLSPFQLAYIYPPYIDHHISTTIYQSPYTREPFCTSLIHLSASSDSQQYRNGHNGHNGHRHNCPVSRYWRIGNASDEGWSRAHLCPDRHPAARARESLWFRSEM